MPRTPELCAVLICARFLSLAAAACLVSACAGPAGPAGPENLHRVDDKVWRSGQPTLHDARHLEAKGIREILSLRYWFSDDHLTGPFEIHRVRMQAHAIDDEEMAEALSILVHSDDPILVHCWHGSDRTGALIALYRMVVQNWPRERAIEELMDPRYGHHADTFPNVRQYLEHVDIDAMRRRVRSRSSDQ